MFKQLATYRLRIKNVRQKYITLLRRRIQVERAKVTANLTNKIIKGFFFTSILTGAFYYGNEVYSEHIEIKKMKKKLMKAYPSQTYIVSFDEDPMELMREVQIKSVLGEHEINRIQNLNCILLKDQSEETKKLKQKLGSTVIVFSPKSIDQLSHAIQRCNKYRHRALVGFYPMPSDTHKQNFKPLKQALSSIVEPLKKKKYIVIDLSQFNNSNIDKINNILQAETGTKCRQVNQLLLKNGYDPIFQQFCLENTIYDVIANNWPLFNNQSLTQKLQNLSLISADGNRFKSSTQVQSFGQIPNLTPLFIGTGGSFAIPALASLKINYKSQNQPIKTYLIQSQNLSELVLKWRQILQYLSVKRINYSLQIKEENKILLKTLQPLQMGSFLGNQAQRLTEDNQKIKPNYIFSINNRILEKILLNPFKGVKLSIENNLLKIQSHDDNQVNRFISLIGIEGAVLVWCDNKDIYNNIKERTDLTETGAQLMKKIVEIRQGIDKKHILYSHSRYEKYFAKGFFRKITEFFW